MFSPGTIAPAHTDDETWFVFRDNTLLVLDREGAVRLPRRRELPPQALAASNRHYLGELDEHHCFTCVPSSEIELPPEGEWQGLRALFGRLDDTTFALAGRALQVVEWDSTHRFCGRCGTPTERHASERSRLCPQCGLVHYPRLAPAVMALIRRGDQLLLARSPRFPPDMFSALAGFVEPGETLEETLVREVREEVGLEIANPRYFGSQPWPFPHSLMLAFVVDYAGGEIVPQPDEIEAAGWFTIDRLPRLPHAVSIARRLIDATVAEIAAGR